MDKIIERVETYQQRYIEDGRAILKSLLVLIGYPDGETKTYIGRGVVDVHTPGGAMKMNLEFEIVGAKSVEKAFDRYDEFLHPAIEKMKEDILRQQSGNILRPGDPGFVGIKKSIKI